MRLTPNSFEISNWRCPTRAPQRLDQKISSHLTRWIDLPRLQAGEISTAPGARYVRDFACFPCHTQLQQSPKLGAGSDRDHSSGFFLAADIRHGTDLSDDCATADAGRDDR